MSPECAVVNDTRCCGNANPSLVCSDSAPPSAFRPNSGLEPDITLMLAIAGVGRMSQAIVSPNGSFIRTPSRYTARPSDDPSSGDATNPAEHKVRLERARLCIAHLHGHRAAGQERRRIHRERFSNLLGGKHLHVGRRFAARDPDAMNRRHTHDVNRHVDARLRLRGRRRLCVRRKREQANDDSTHEQETHRPGYLTCRRPRYPHSCA